MSVEKFPAYQLHLSENINITSIIPAYTETINLVLVARALQILKDMPAGLMIPLEVQAGAFPSIAISTLGLAEMGVD